MEKKLLAEEKNADRLAGTIIEFANIAQKYVAFGTEAKDPEHDQAKAHEIILRFEEAIAEIALRVATSPAAAARSREEFAYDIGFLEGLAHVAVSRKEGLEEFAKCKKVLLYGIAFDKALNPLRAAIRDDDFMASISYERLRDKLALRSKKAALPFEMDTALSPLPVAPVQDATDQLAKTTAGFLNAAREYVAFGTQKKDPVHDRIRAETALQGLTQTITELADQAKANPQDVPRSREKLARDIGFLKGLAYSHAENPHGKAFNETLMSLLEATQSTPFIQSVSYTLLREKLTNPLLLCATL